MLPMNDQHREERRKMQRFPFKKDILINGLTSCTSMEINEGGLLVSAIQNFKEGKVIDLIIPFDGEQITVRGEVRFCQPGIGMGVMFLDLNDKQKEKIKELVERISGRSS